MEVQESVFNNETRIAYKRRNSRDCVIPETIKLPLTTKQPSQESPTLKIEDCSSVMNPQTISWTDHTKYSSSTIEILDPCRISELSQSPEHLGRQCFHGDAVDRRRLLSVSPSHSERETSPDEGITIHNCPSSPLLVAMRNAVDSLNKYEDFKILEKIGAGFFAEVFKVSILLFFVEGCFSIQSLTAVHYLQCPIASAILTVTKKLQ